MKALEVRKDISLTVLRGAAKAEKDAKVYQRLLGIMYLQGGKSRKEAEQAACLTSNVFRIWIRRFNAQGVEGL